MRLLLFLVALLIPLGAWAQDDPTKTDLVRPDAYIEIKRDNAGTDVLQISMLADNYPIELLREQLAALGKELGTEPRIIYAETHNPLTGKAEGGRLRVTAAVPGLVNREGHILGLQALARAFAGAKAPYTVDGLMLQYASEKPDARTLQSYQSSSVRVVGLASQQTGVEYRLTLLNQDPAAITIPEGRDPDAATRTTVPAPPQQGPSIFIIAVIFVAAIAVGALVYSLLLRPRPKGHSR